ncbi:hypothetical protein MRX96_003084 [Rhipicephalus microplus]
MTSSSPERRVPSGSANQREGEACTEMRGERKEGTLETTPALPFHQWLPIAERTKGRLATKQVMSGDSEKEATALVPAQDAEEPSLSQVKEKMTLVLSAQDAKAPAVSPSEEDTSVVVLANGAEAPAVSQVEECLSPSDDLQSGVSPAKENVPAVVLAQDSEAHSGTPTAARMTKSPATSTSDPSPGTSLAERDEPVVPAECHGKRRCEKPPCTGCDRYLHDTCVSFRDECGHLTSDTEEKQKVPVEPGNVPVIPTAACGSETLTGDADEQQNAPVEPGNVPVLPTAACGSETLTGDAGEQQMVSVQPGDVPVIPTAASESEEQSLSCQRNAPVVEETPAEKPHEATRLDTEAGNISTVTRRRSESEGTLCAFLEKQSN